MRDRPTTTMFGIRMSRADPAVFCPICRAQLPVDIDSINTHMESHRVVEPTPTLRALLAYWWRRFRAWLPW
ncbi:MAG: hypothetical protein ACRDZM_15075 [Acidimicrobiia bacterium]